MNVFAVLLLGAVLVFPAASLTVLGPQVRPLEVVGLVPLLAVAYGATAASISRWLGLGLVTSCGILGICTVAAASVRMARDASARTAALRTPLIFAIGSISTAAVQLAIDHGRPLRFMLPFYDTVQHGYIAGVARSRDTADLARLLSFDVVTGPPAVKYYPSASHETIALLSRATGLDVPHVLVAVFVLSGCVAYPALIWSFTRRLGMSRAAGAAGVAVGCTLFDVPVGGGALFAALVGTIVCAAIPLLLTSLDSERPLFGVVVVGCCLYGATHCYPSSLLVAGLLCLLLLAHDSRVGSAVAGLHRVRWQLAGGTLLALLLMSPILRSFTSAYSERSAINVRTGRAFGDAVSAWARTGFYGIRLPVAVRLVAILLEVAGIALWLRTRRPAMAACAIGLIVVELIQVLSDLAEPWAAVGSLWYRSPQRVGLMAGPARGLAAATAVAAVLAGVGASRWMLSRASAALLVSVTAVAGLHGVDGLRTQVRAGRTLDGGLTDASAQLAKLAGPDEIVLTDYCQGSSWIMALDGRRPTFGLLNSDPGGQPELTVRRVMLSAIATRKLDVTSRELLRELAPRYALLSDREVCDVPSTLTPRSIAGNGAFREVWTNSIDHLYVIDLEALLAE